MEPDRYPGGLSELRFVDAYWRLTLRKPQVGADAALRAMVTAGAGDRGPLVGVLASHAAEAARRLVAVYSALDDRTYPIARRLQGPLPGRDAWDEFVSTVMALQPSQLTWRLGVGEDGLAAAERMRSMGDPTWLGPLVSAAEHGTLLIDGPGERDGRIGVAIAGQPEVEALRLSEDDAASLADATADMVSVARGLLGSYLDARRVAGRRD
jgi:hypothetical protein